jgi:putative copper resistance protein D
VPAVRPIELLTDWGLDPAAAIVIALTAGLYAQGVRRLAAKGRRWSPARSAAMAGALVAATLATQSGIATHEDQRMWVHMVQHVLIAMVVPLLVTLSAPLTLALQTGRPGTRRLLRRALRSRAIRLLTHPLVGWALFGGGMAVLYLTPLLDMAAENGLVHLTIHAHMTAAGVLFLAPLLGVDPLPRRLPHPARLLALLAAVPFHAVVALAMTSATSPVAPSAYPLLADQRNAAALFWGSGELFTLIVAAVIVRQWWLSEQRATAREDAALDAAAARAAAGSPS